MYITTELNQYCWYTTKITLRHAIQYGNWEELVLDIQEGVQTGFCGGSKYTGFQASDGGTLQ